MKRIATSLAALLLGVPILAYAADDARPNIVVIIADDLGYGDLGCYGGTAIPTPNVDRLCQQGLKMTHCYATASTCTPTRYSMLTGQYAFRPQKRSTSILDGDAPLAIEPGSPTLPSMLRDAGYHTALIGKWHLGIGDGQDPVDFNKHVGPGPLEVGFDQAFYIPATVDRVPCVFIENHHVHQLDPNDPIAISYQHPVGDDPIARERPELLKYRGDNQHSDVIVNGVGRIGYMSGGHAARWVDEDITDVLATRVTTVIEQERQEPLFLLLGTHDPHKPHLPHQRFQGKSQCGRRGDSIVQFDWLVGAVVEAIAAAGLSDNTLLFITSDNGPAIFDGYYEGAQETLGDHKPGGPFRGLKYTVYEGGCRVPGIVYWPGRVAPGVTDEIFGLIDLPASLPGIAGVDQLPAELPGDTLDLSHVLLGESVGAERESIVLQGIGKGRAIVTQRWKFIPKTTVGQSSTEERLASQRDPRFGDVPIHEDALYDLAAESYEQTNVIEEYPEIAKRLKHQLSAVLAEP